MTKFASKGPVITLVAAAALGIGMFSVNVAQEDQAAQPAGPAVSVATSTVAPIPPAKPSPPAPAPFPAKAAFHADIPTRNGTLTLDIKVNGAKATAYACDSYGIEKWLAGSAVDGVVSMNSDEGSSRLTGRHEGNTVVGNLSIGDKQWAYTAAAVAGDNNV
ncbi:hypothetical protein BH09ACT7_BH09ACT7_49290 [soil metagenome]